MIEKIGAAVSREENLFEKINEIIEPYKTGIIIQSILDIDKVLNHIKTPVNNKLMSELAFLENCKSSIVSLKNEITLIDTAYTEYFVEFEKISNDVQNIMQTFLSDLLTVGKKVLDKKYHRDESCPLCLQPQSVEDLKQEINDRLKEIEESSKKKVVFDNAKQSILLISDERLKRIDAIGANILINDNTNLAIKTSLSNLQLKITAYQKAGNEKVTSGIKINNPVDLKFQPSDFFIIESISNRISQIQTALKSDNTTVLYSNISAAKDAFVKIKRFEIERTRLEAQKNSLELIFNEFVKKQKDGLENFINAFSVTINDFYQFMNPGELFEEIKIVTIGEDDELNGITIEYSYNNNQVSPPQKYFSESHLNCFGISFFLASVIAFNKKNKFLILDDVISSFDSNHRKRFADLLFEKFKDWQIILLTHEEEWFQYVRQLAKKNNWLITEVKWHDDNKSTFLDEKPKDLKELIETSISNGNINLLGNPIRKYLEHILKNICLNLEVKLSFRYNDINEKRMPDEMLNELKAKINRSSNDLKAKIPIIDRLANSSQLGNLLSHDNSFNPKIGDLKAFWNDILELEKIFICEDTACKKVYVSLKNYDTVAKTIRCGCDKTKYDWKI